VISCGSIHRSAQRDAQVWAFSGRSRSGERRISAAVPVKGDLARLGGNTGSLAKCSRSDRRRRERLCCWPKLTLSLPVTRHVFHCNCLLHVLSYFFTRFVGNAYQDSTAVNTTKRISEADCNRPWVVVRLVVAPAHAAREVPMARNWGVQRRGCCNGWDDPARPVVPGVGSQLGGGQPFVEQRAEAHVSAAGFSRRPG
jgi:hypothetical protein